ncbi:hypothetical protein NA56DRAFT_743445 [Hyaloscypha hepaticicola]|uniref:Rhodopsin domain-containing protein n=1 Tax=Hyaloscypha hepaticicola TaxID=2082293 RepID=A0A2J6QLG8_9HELO|nr:hypothetical protein NA56DRAFT_743445 [Hyaloscypha hepaticicola]
MREVYDLWGRYSASHTSVPESPTVVHASFEACLDVTFPHCLLQINESIGLDPAARNLEPNTSIMASSISASDVGFAPQSRAPQTLIASIVPAVVASIFVLARFYSRAFIMKNWGHDDSWILFSWVLGSIALTTLNSILTARTPANQGKVQTTEDIELAMRLGFASQELYQVCLGTTKLGICAFYLRIFQDRISKVIIRSTMGPISGDWNMIPAVCGNQDPGIITSATVNILSDVILIAFVTPRILPLNITKQQKISLLSIVSLGLLVIVAAAMRATFTLRVLAISDAQPWSSYQIAIWSAVEVNSGLLCAAAPAIKPVLRKIAPRLVGPYPKNTFSTDEISDSRKTAISGCDTV